MLFKIQVLLGWFVVNIVFMSFGVGFGFLLRLIFPLDWGQAILIGCISVFATYYAIYRLILDSTKFVDINADYVDEEDDYVNEIKAKVYNSVTKNVNYDLLKKRKSSRK